ncbi:MAG: N-acetylglucosamine-6-phosphate deacetylase [Clostridia bacterium]|nr:N-acetylglucosamine-6-phosphate deacetylase [Clostridia bacterium]
MSQEVGRLEPSSVVTVILGGDLIAPGRIINDGELIIQKGKIQAVGPRGTAAHFLAKNALQRPGQLVALCLGQQGTRMDLAYLEKRLILSGPAQVLGLGSSPITGAGKSAGGDTSTSYTLEVLDARGHLVAPGFIDLHVHGAGGGDFTTDPLEGWMKAARMLARFGTTAFLATTLASDPKTLETALDTAAKLQSVFHNWQSAGGSYGNTLASDTLPPGAYPLGVHLEGPYLNPDYAGGQPLGQIRPANARELEDLLKAGARLISQKPFPTACGSNLVRMVTLAPEIAGASSLLKVLRDYDVIASTGHTGATYEQFKVAVAKGVAHVTHLFNAMRGFHHREPGTAGAAIDCPEVTLELIADGHHVHPAVIRLLVGALLGERRSALHANQGGTGLDRLVLITDAMSACGLPEGDYDLGGQQVVVKDGIVRLVSPTAPLAGSILTLNQAIRNMMEWTGMSLTQAINLASLNPARRLGIDGAKGSLEPGKDADVVIVEPNFEVRLTMINGLVRYIRDKYSASCT